MAKDTRLQKYLADCGIASRRKAEELIANGDVTVNGKRAVIGDKIDVRTDKVFVSGRKIETNKKNVYIMLNKPRGYVTTMSDEKGRKCVAQLVSDVGVRVYPVGRLDMDSEGLLLLTNDGELANILMHPSGHVSKTYLVTVKAVLSEEQLTALATGIMLDGRKTLPAGVHVVAADREKTVVEIVLREGRNRQIRRMLEELGVTEIAKLKRVQMGPVALGNLKLGQYRELTKQEISALKRACNGKQ